MKPRHAVINIILLLALFLSLTIAFAQQTDIPQTPSKSMNTPSPGQSGMGNLPMPPPGGGGGICTDGKYLYILQGPWIYQYTIPDLKLKTTVELPKPKLP